MHNRIVWACALTLALIVLPLRGADQAPNTVVIVSGSGTDEKAALRDAFANAIGQVVGTIVDAETIVKNDQIIQERILTASGAIISKYEVVKAPFQEDGSLKLRIKATVETNLLLNQLGSINVITKDVKGGDLFAQAVTDLERIKDGPQIIRRAFENFPANVMKGEPIGEPRVITKRGNETVLGVTVRLSIDEGLYSRWINAVRPFLERIALNKQPIRFNPSDDKGLSELGSNFRNVPAALRRNCFAYNGHPTIIPREVEQESPEGSILIALLERQGSSKGVVLCFDSALKDEILRATATMPVAQVRLLDDRKEEIEGTIRPLVFDDGKPPTTSDEYIVTPLFNGRNLGALYRHSTSSGTDGLLKWRPSDRDMGQIRAIIIAPYIHADRTFPRNLDAIVRGIDVEFPFTLLTDELSRLKQVQVRIDYRNNVK